MLNTEDQRPQIPDHQLVVAHMMTPGVVQIPGDLTVTEAASLLEREQMPCLLIKDTESRFGLMTATDIVKKVLVQGLEPDEIEVRAIMSRPVQFIEYDRAVAQAAALMMSTGSTILIVTKQNQPVGVLTAGDLARSPTRCRTRIPATIRVTDEQGQGGAPHHAVIIELSHVGALVESPVWLLPSTQVMVQFALPPLDDVLSIQGTIIEHGGDTEAADHLSSLPPRVDVQFAHLTESDESRIHAWVLHQTPLTSDLS